MTTKVKIEVEKKQNESNVNLLRRFSRRFRDSGMVPLMRANRYASRSQSKLKLKKSALHRQGKKVEYAKMEKMGKLPTRS